MTAPPNAEYGGQSEPNDGPMSVETERRVALRLLSILDPVEDADLIAEITSQVPPIGSSGAA